jgi:FlaA1/EpsC-like NDP-sugar epimerase
MTVIPRLLRSRLARLALIHDTAMAALSFVVALYLRVGETEFSYYAESFLGWGVVLFTAIAAVVFLFTGLYRGIWRYASLADMIAIVKAVSLAVLIFLPLMFLVTRLQDFPRSLLVINWFVLIAMLAGPRIFYRILKDRRLDNVLSQDSGNKIPVLLLGAGDPAELFLRGVTRTDGVPYAAVGIIAEKKRRVGRRIHGVEVLGQVDDMEEVVARLAKRGRKPRRLILTKDDLESGTMREIYERAEALGMTLARIPRPTDFRSGMKDRLELRPIAIEDLLGRPQAVLDRDAMRRLITGKRIMVTGAGGSIGGELVRQIAEYGPAQITLLDNSEYHLYEIDLELARAHGDLPRTAVLADVRDAARIGAAFAEASPDIVFHAAALKHVPMVEANPAEGLLTNVAGTKIVADACRTAGVEAMVLISTDKAVNPPNVMGASKRLAEAYCQALDLMKDGKTRFVTVRFGNVLGSTGSVVPLFQKQLAEGGPLTVTHPEVTRYFMTVREAVELVLMASAMGAQDGGESSGKIFVLDMGDPVRIQDLARQMIRLAGLEPDKDIQVQFTGLRPGEKLYEELLHESENLVASGQDGLLLAAPRTADAKLLAKAIAEIETQCRSGDAEAALRIVSRLVPEYRPALLGQAHGAATGQTPGLASQ